MRKAEIASYLVSLHSLIEAQMKSPHSTVSPILAAEYTLHWDMLKQKIMEEYNETRQSNEQPNGLHKDAAYLKSNQPRKSEHDRSDANSRDGNEANDLWPRS